MLWNLLKNKKLLGYDFHRQKQLEDQGITFLRFEDMDVRYDLDKVL